MVFMFLFLIKSENGFALNDCFVYSMMILINCVIERIYVCGFVFLEAVAEEIPFL